MVIRFQVENYGNNAINYWSKIFMNVPSRPSDKVLIGFCKGVYQTGVILKEPGATKFVAAQSLPEHWPEWHVVSNSNRRFIPLP